jgi:hypothetical protein
VQAFGKALALVPNRAQRIYFLFADTDNISLIGWIHTVLVKLRARQVSL